jgi:hypothetical protein
MFSWEDTKEMNSWVDFFKLMTQKPNVNNPSFFSEKINCFRVTFQKVQLGEGKLRVAILGQRLAFPTILTKFMRLFRVALL